MGIVVVEGGPQALVQDTGRRGLTGWGVGEGGVMDPWELQAANRLLGNGPGAAGIEVTLGPFRALNEVDTGLVLVGQASGSLGGRAVTVGEPVLWSRGQMLVITAAVRAVVAIGGGIEVPVVLGSRSTHLRGGFGGFAGRALRSGDRLAVGSWDWPGPEAWGWRLRSEPVVERLRVVWGPDARQLGRRSRLSFLAGEFTVGREWDRMGMRLDAPGFLAPPARAHERSMPEPFGALEVTGPGRLLALLADRPATGGYPLLAVLASVDRGRLARLVPGARVRFAVLPRRAARRLGAQRRASAWERRAGRGWRICIDGRAFGVYGEEVEAAARPGGA